MNAQEIIQKMVDEMPYDLERRIVPYIEEAMTIYAEAKAKEFAEWVNKNYDLVTSEELEKSAWVSLSNGILIHGSDFHYTKLISEFGQTIEQLYEIFKQKP
jgi:hypothetical protein